MRGRTQRGVWNSSMNVGHNNDPYDKKSSLSLLELLK